LVTAIAQGSPGRLFLARDAEVHELDANSGEALRRVASGRGVTAIHGSEDGMLLGYEDGALAFSEAGHDDVTGTPTFENLPTRAVTVVTEGVPGSETVVAGSEDGEVGIWSLADGSRLLELHLHGPVRFLRIFSDRLVAVSELGDARDIDLSVFTLPPRELLRQVRAQVSVLWSDGAAGRRAPTPATDSLPSIPGLSSRGRVYSPDIEATTGSEEGDQR